MKYDIKIFFSNKEQITLNAIEEESAERLFNCMSQSDHNLYLDQAIYINKSHVSLMMKNPTAPDSNKV